MGEILSYIIQLGEMFVFWLINLPLNQIAALIFIMIFMWVFDLTFSASYETKENNIVVNRIEKVNKWPEIFIKISWLFLIFIFHNQLWFAFLIVFIMVGVVMSIIGYFAPNFLKIFQPIITEEEKRSLK